MKMMTFDRILYIDTRERSKQGRMGILKAADKLGLDAKVQTLEEGDVRAGQVRAERKAFMDFLNSFVQSGGTGWDQITRLLRYCDKHHELPVLGVVSGTLPEMASDIKVAQRYVGGISVRSAYQSFAELAIRYPELKMIWVPNDLALVQMVYDMAIVMDDKKLGKPKYVTIKKYADIRKKPVQTLCNIFRIPADEAKRVWIYYGSFKKIFTADKRAISRIPGVSIITARKLTEK